jgi:hypothetical protein
MNPTLGRKSSQAIKVTPAAIRIAISGSGIIVDLTFQSVKIFVNDKLDLDYTKFMKYGQLKHPSWSEIPRKVGALRIIDNL